jgi:hypothetical protein
VMFPPAGGGKKSRAKRWAAPLVPPTP